jgi:hypothetical protein
MKVITLVLLMINFMKLASNQPCINSVADCSRVQSSAEIMARRILMSSLNNRYTNVVGEYTKSRVSRTGPYGTHEQTSNGGEEASELRAEGCQ